MEKLKKLREDLILKGKHSPKFQNVPKRFFKVNSAKYTELDNTENSGAINLKDAEVLYDLVCKFKPRKIFEVGTWFGTSSLVMATAMDDEGIGGEIHTCDNQDYYVGDHPKIIFYHGKSTAVLRRLKRMEFDMVFMDGRFKTGDAKRISKILKHGVFVTHDYVKGRKGFKNVKAMRRFRKKAKLIKPCKGSSVAWLKK